jgi:hypothetical protein
LRRSWCGIGGSADRVPGCIVQGERPRGRLASGLPVAGGAGGLIADVQQAEGCDSALQPVCWDSTWIDLDRVLHGTDPWRLLQPVVGYPAVTALLALLFTYGFCCFT